MKIFLIILCVILILTCLLSYWRDISSFVPQRAEELTHRVKAMAENIFSHLIDTITEDIRKVENIYDGIVANNH